MDGKIIGNQAQQGQEEGFSNYLREYEILSDDLHVTMSLAYFCTIKYRNMPREYNMGPHNFELQRIVEKLIIPSFDRSSKCTTRSWVQKLDTCFQHILMLESEAIKFSTLHLDGESHEWWYHGLVTLGHASIMS